MLIGAAHRISSQPFYLKYVSRSWLEKAYLGGSSNYHVPFDMVNTCIDFIVFKGPYSNQRWALLYVYGMRFKHGVWLSVN